jgi:hypothetical protein
MTWFYSGGSNPLLVGLQAYWPLNEAAGNPRVDVINGLQLVEVSGVPVATIAGAHGRLMASSPFGSSTNLNCNDPLIAVGDFDFTFAFTTKGTVSGQAPYLCSWIGPGGALADAAIAFQSAVDYPGLAQPPNTYYYKNSSDGNYQFLQDSGTPTGAAPVNTIWHVVGWHDSVNNVVGLASSLRAEVTAARTTGIFAAQNLSVCRSEVPATYGSDRHMQDFCFWNRVLTPAERATMVSGVDPMTIFS